MAQDDNPLDKMDEIITCIMAVNDLMLPDGDIQFHQRSHIATLLDYLTREYEQARNQLSH